MPNKSQAERTLENLDKVPTLDLGFVAQFAGISLAEQYKAKSLEDLRPLIRKRLQKIIRGERYY